MVRSFLYVALAVSLAVVPVVAQQQTSQSKEAATVLPDYSRPVSWFPAVARPYREEAVRSLDLQNSPALLALIHDGRLTLSLADALRLAIENNLDIAVQRFLFPIAQADILRTSSGQAARGVGAALVPSGLSQGALGVGVNAASGIGGVGSAGGISGGGGAVSVAQAGNFDPALSIASSYDHTVSPLNSLVVAGVPQVATRSAANTISYAQMFPEGSSFNMSFSGIAQNSTQQSLLFNPAVVSRMAVGFNQPLLSGAGFLPNKRFIMVAVNNLQTSQDLFREQVTTTVVQAENAYWSLEADRDAVAAAQSAYDAALELVRQTKDKVEVGTAARVDVTSAESAAASSQRDLVVAQTNLQLQQSQLKGMLSKQMTAEMDAAEIEIVDPLPDPANRPDPNLDDAVRTALKERPELTTAARNLQNQDVTVKFTDNSLLPTVSAFGLSAAAGLAGNTPLVSGGLGGSLFQDFQGSYPEFAAGVSATVVLRNRAAQADSVRARLEDQQLQIQTQQSQQQIGLEVRQAVISLVQGKAQVAAAREAVRLASETVDAERGKLEEGFSTAYTVILRERDLLTARQAEVAAMVAYARGLVDFDRATGQTLERRGIQLSDALVGQLAAPPTPTSASPGRVPAK